MPREDGAIIIGATQVASTLMCPHCGNHFLSFARSGARRTWCLKCAAVTCGDPKCDPCAPFEARLERAEGKRTRYDDAIIESGFLL